jgi:hypothetical protein
VDDDLNDDQRVLLDASTRFTEANCPLPRLRDGAFDDAGPQATPACAKQRPRDRRL